MRQKIDHQHSKSRQYRLWQQLLTLLLLLVICVLTVAFFLKGRLPSVTNIYPQMLEEPIQTATSREPFVFDYRGKRYDVEPVAEYILAGVVVSHNNIDSFADIYHDDDSVDLKDLCIIWGKNLETDDFHKVDFWSNAWTCNWSYYGDLDFSNREVSNNHLLAADKRIQEQIKDVRIGDQVILQGMLVDYSPEGTDWKRVSSRTRDDTENGACEVMFVEAAEIVKAGQPVWNPVFDYGKWLLGAILLFKFISFVLYSRYEKKLFDIQERERMERIRKRDLITYKGGY